MSEQRILISSAAVLSLDSGTGDQARADILIEDGRIAAIGTGLTAGDAHVIDASGHLVLPGFVDTHRHTWQAAFRGLAADWSLQEYGAGLHGTLKPHFRPEDVYLGNLLGRAEALNSGITTMLDWSHCLSTPDHTDAAAAGLRDCPGRSVFGYSGGFGLPGNDPIEADLRRIRDGFHDDDLVTLALALRGPQYSRMGVVKDDVALARELGLRVTVHGGSAEWGRRRPVGRMHEHGLLDDRTTVVHCTTLADDELRLMADVGATASVSPDVELLMGFGWPATGRLLDAGIRPSLSIDDCAAVGGDMFGTMRTTFVTQRGLDTPEPSPGRDRITCRDVVEFATIEGARACGLADRIGSIRVGKEADLVLLRGDDLSVFPVNNLAGTVVLQAHPGLVDTVLVRGEIVKENGTLAGIDLPRLRERAAASRDAVVDAVNAARPAADRIRLDGTWRPSTEDFSDSKVNPS
ncbi:amidohydrolase family protein [Amycolatopsis pithecellobii]|uniref:Amidohydrolase family protein n=1 Tax=Amycolatopsis pithecellobii TaxID=664692 RepID=A0A6N7Z323_9PSEU|nr:amidohydrolase family protein [Amycolatopsis pithecellobii]MTD54344.1 amidohydrolase family protein [Amycolatopsis pithecellobii]